MIRTERATGKLMLSIFWDSEGIIHREFLPRGQTINSERYINTTRKLKRRLQSVRSHHPVFLLQHDNASAHARAVTTAAIEQLGFEVIPYLPQSPDLAPSDYYSFRHLKKALKGTRHSSDPEWIAAVSSFFRLQSPEFFETGTRKLILRWLRRIELNGDYVELKYMK